MSKQSQENEQLIEEAEAWVVKLRSDNVSVEDKEKFSIWLNHSDAHVKTFDKTLALWESLSAVSYIPESTFDDDQPVPQSSLDSIKSQPNFMVSIKSWQVALACATVCLFSLLTYNWLQPTSEPSTERYATAKGELLSVELADGSMVELNTETVLDVLYTRDTRNLTLVSGEAYFSVASNKQRPFVVSFGNGSATAVGTAFNIYSKPSGTSVTVTEGIVDVKEPAELAVPKPESTRVVANQQVKIGRRGVGPVKNIDTSRSLAWRESTIIFRDTPLATAIGELNRYLDRPVDIADSGISDLNVSGTFSLKSPVETLDAITTAFNLRKIKSADQHNLYVLTE